MGADPGTTLWLDGNDLDRQRDGPPARGSIVSALADTLRALMPFAEKAHQHGRNALIVENDARDALRKHAPCEGCRGEGRVTSANVVDDKPAQVTATCPTCNLAGWTPASVGAAIAREERREHEARIIWVGLRAGVEVGIGMASGGYCPWVRFAGGYQNAGPCESEDAAERLIPRLIEALLPEHIRADIDRR